MYQAIILTTNNNDNEYWIGKSITWKKIKVQVKKMEKVEKVFIYFTAKVKNGESKSRRINGSSILFYANYENITTSGQIKIKLTHKCTPLKIQQLRDVGIIAEKSCMRGNIFYLNQCKYDKLIEVLKRMST
jgi:hypothetical protein